MLICLLLRVNSHDEKVAMNEVFAHAAFIKHKHVLRYCNSWVEKGQVSYVFGSGGFLTLGYLDTGWLKTQDPDPGSEMNIPDPQQLFSYFY
jgi:prephenate dehydrogenase